MFKDFIAYIYNETDKLPDLELYKIVSVVTYLVNNSDLTSVTKLEPFLHSYLKISNKNHINRLRSLKLKRGMFNNIDSIIESVKERTEDFALLYELETERDIGRYIQMATKEQIKNDLEIIENIKEFM